MVSIQQKRPVFEFTLWPGPFCMEAAQSLCAFPLGTPASSYSPKVMHLVRLTGDSKLGV